MPHIIIHIRTHTSININTRSGRRDDTILRGLRYRGMTLRVSRMGALARVGGDTFMDTRMVIITYTSIVRAVMCIHIAMVEVVALLMMTYLNHGDRLSRLFHKRWI